MSNATTKLLSNQFKDMCKNPVELKDNNIFEWWCYMAGPIDTVYQGGIFKMLMTFPEKYPYEPPKLAMLSDFWHPNVYTDGRVCISILHPPGEDAMSGERPEERWLPIHTPETILLSVMSMFADPNCSSPANVDAGVEWRKNRNGYKKRVNILIEKSKKALPKGFVMPKAKPPKRKTPTPVFDSWEEKGEVEWVIDDDDDDEFDDEDDGEDGSSDGEIDLDEDGEVDLDDDDEDDV